MLTFTARFSRYCSARGERRISGPQSISAETFADAHRRAQDILLGLRGGDPTFMFDVHSIEGRAHRAVTCDGGVYLFETDDELAYRMKEPGK